MVARVASAVEPLPKSSWPSETDERPVPPPPTPRVPARVLVKVSVSPEPVMVVEAVSPLNAVEEVAKVTVGPSAVWFAGPIAVKAVVK